MWALKLGGSILHAAPDDPQARARAALLDDLSCQPGRYLLVPGGGRHADAVRAAQREQGFDDDAAHVRALAAMDRCAAELAVLLGVTARVIHHLSDARAAATAGYTPVWAPHAELASDPSLPRTWSLTADSIAAEAARRLGLAGVCLLKSCAVPDAADARALTEAGIVDAEWPHRVRGLRSRVLGPEAWAAPAGLQAAIDVVHASPP